MFTAYIARLVCVTTLLLALAAAVCAQETPVVGAFASIVREVQTTGVAQRPPASWLPARKDAPVHAGAGVRTLKRSLAEIKFLDGSLLRVNERTDLVVQQAANLRTVKLSTGAVWVRVAKGANTSVETPTCTAHAKGTIFVVAVNPDGSTQVTVLEGTVEVSHNGVTVPVTAGQTVHVGGGGEIGAVTAVPPADLPVGSGGAAVTWWSGLASGTTLSVTAGTSITDALRASPVTDITAALEPQRWMFGDLTDSFMTISGNIIAPNVLQVMANEHLATLGDFEAAHGNDSVALYLTPTTPVKMTNQEFLNSLGVYTIGQDLDAYTTNGGTWPPQGGVSVIVKKPLLRSPSPYRPGAINVSDAELRILDQTRSSTAVLAGGLAAGLLADHGNWTLSSPTFDGLLYGFAGGQGFFGARGDMRGLIGNTRYVLEGNAIELTNDPATDLQSRLGSVAVVERDLGKWTLFAGRDRFIRGPVFQNALNTQLIADRYSGFGARTDQGSWGFEGAWLYDSNPFVAGAQPGATATLFARWNGGIFSAHLLETGQIANGHGRTVSFTYPVITNQLDVYGEIGHGIDDAAISTVGVYLPDVYQRYDVDTFIEYASHEGVGKALSVVGCKTIDANLEARAYMNIINGGADLGVGAIWRFGKPAGGHEFGTMQQ